MLKKLAEKLEKLLANDDFEAHRILYKEYMKWQKELDGLEEGNSRAILVSDYDQKNVEIYKKEFAVAIYNKALKIQDETGIPAAIITAQAILESGYGSKVPTEGEKFSYNLFGIKGTGPAGSVLITTKEEVGGNKIAISDYFRAYDSYDQAMEDHADILNRLYRPEVPTIENWATNLQEKGYATDSKYKELILSIIKSWKLK